MKGLSVPWLRRVLAMLMIGAALLWSAPFIRSFGFGGWVVGVILSTSLPFAVAVVAGRPVWLPGVVTAVAIAASFWFHDVVLRSNRLYADRPDDAAFVLSCFGIELVLGLIASAAAHLVTRVSNAPNSPGFEVLPPKN
jgi:hypothetical protein